MTELETDARYAALVATLEPLLHRSTPEGAGGYAGSVQLVLPPDVLAQLGGAGLVRAALRSAAQGLGWKEHVYEVTTSLSAGSTTGIGVLDTRRPPYAYQEAKFQAMMRIGETHVRALRGMALLDDTCEPPSGALSLRGTPVLQTKEFLAAAADQGLLR